MRLPELSAFFPAYNEEANLDQLVNDGREAFSKVADRYEIILVNDGSSDKTLQVANRLAEQYPEVVVVNHEQNQGYGAAVRSGMKAARYRYVFFSDADNQFDLAEISSLAEKAGEADIVTGYRLKRQDPFHRRAYSFAWTWLGRVLFGYSVRDTNCAFKLFKKEVLEAVTLTSDGAMINTEFYAQAAKRGFSVTEVPVHHYPRQAGTQTGGNPKVIFKAFSELFKLYGRLKKEGSGGGRSG